MEMLKIIQLDKDNIYSLNTSLRKPSEPVTDFGSEFQSNVDKLLEVFYNWKIAVGLSAPQVGIQKRFAIINPDKSKKEDTIVMVNPIILSESGKKDLKYESCLSIPQFKGEVERRKKIYITYFDRYGIKKNLTAEGFLARIFLHEIDHLNGVLFVDRMKPDTILEHADIKWE